MEWSKKVFPLLLGCSIATVFLSQGIKAEKIACNNRNGLTFERFYFQNQENVPEENRTRLHMNPGALLQLPDRGYLIGGSYRQDRRLDSNRSIDAWLMRVDARGKLKWSKVFWHPNKKACCAEEGFHDLIATAPNRYVAVGNILSLSEDNRHRVPMLIQINKGGKVLWKKYLNTPYDEHAPSLLIQSITPIGNGEFVGVGSAPLRFWDDEHHFYYYKTFSWMVRIRGDGEVIASKVFRNNALVDKYGWGGDFYASAVKNGYLYMLGSILDPENSVPQLLLIKSDLDGNIVWAKTIRQKIDQDEGGIWWQVGNGIVATPDGLLLSMVAYWLDPHGGEAGPYHYLLSIDESGDLHSAVWYGEVGNAYGYSKDFRIKNLKKGPRGRYFYRRGYLQPVAMKIRKDGTPVKGYYSLSRGPNDLWWGSHITPTQDGAIAVADSPDYIDGIPAAVRLFKYRKDGKGAWMLPDEFYNYKVPELPKVQNILDKIETETMEGFYPDNVELVSASKIRVRKSSAIVTERQGLLSNEGLHLPNKGRFLFRETNRTDIIDGTEYKRYLLKYRGKITAIYVNNYYVDEKGRKIPGGYPQRFYTKIYKDDDIGDNTSPRYINNMYVEKNWGGNNIYVGPVGRELDPKKISPFWVKKNKFIKLWFRNGILPSWADGLYITILNGNKDATVLRYDRETKRTVLIKRPCTKQHKDKSLPSE